MEIDGPAVWGAHHHQLLTRSEGLGVFLGANPLMRRLARGADTREMKIMKGMATPDTGSGLAGIDGNGERKMCITSNLVCRSSWHRPPTFTPERICVPARCRSRWERGIAASSPHSQRPK